MTLKEFYRQNTPLSIRALARKVDITYMRFWGWATGQQYARLYKKEEERLKDYTRNLRDQLNKIDDL